MLFKGSQKIGRAILPVFSLIILIGSLNHFALAQIDNAQDPPATVTATAAPPQPETPPSSPPPPEAPLPGPEIEPALADPELLLRQAAEETFAGRLLPGQVFEVGLIKIVAEWALVNFRVKAAERATEPEAEVYVGLAHWDGFSWTVRLEDSAEFLTWLDQIPAELISAEARPYLKPGQPAAAGAPGLWLPFPVGQTWKYLAGPNGGPRREAVDFGPFSPGESPSPAPTVPLTGQERDVTAAATGIVIDRDAQSVVIRHGSQPAWETGYASLAAASNISQLGQIIYQGQRLGAASAEKDPSKGIHVHFWVRQAGVDQVMAGQLLSEWQIYQDNSYEVGQNRGRIIYKNGVEKIDCPTAERFFPDSNFCHVHHFLITPSPLPTSTVSLSPTNVITLPLGGTAATSVQVNGVKDLYAVKLELSYSPTQSVTVVDAWPDTPGVQVAPGSVFDNAPFAVIRNEVNPDRGLIQFEASRQAPALAFSGTGSLVELAWQRAFTGPVEVNLVGLQLAGPNGRILPAVLTTGTIRFQSGFVIRGQVELQGKDNWAGVTVSAARQQAQTNVTGQFQVGVAGAYRLQLAAPGYLTARAEGNPLALPDAATVNLGRITLPAGEVTGDDQINILDLALIASHYNQRHPLADLNGDGMVNIFDLVMAAANYGRHGPVTAWQ